MTPTEVEQRIAQIEGFIRVLTQQCHILDERRHILAPLINDASVQDALHKKLDRTEGAGAWNHLAPLLGQDLLRDQSRLFLDTHHRSGSLTNLWRKLQADPGLRKHFRGAYAGLFDDFHNESIQGLSPEASATVCDQWREEDRARHGARFDEGWQQVENDMLALSKDPVAIKIKTFRDKHHAHLEMQKLNEEPKAFDPNRVGLTFDEVFAFGDRCQLIVAELGLLLTGINWDPVQFASLHEQRGAAMWKTLAS